MIYRVKTDSLIQADGKQHRVELDDMPYLKSVQLEFNGTLTASGGSSDGSLQEDGLLRCVAKSMRLVADGSDRAIDSDAIGEYWRRAIMSGSAGVLKSTMPTGAAATAQRFSATIDMDQIVSAARFVGRIDPVNLDKLILHVDNGVCETDMVTGGDRTEVLTGTLEVVAVYDSSPKTYRGGGRRISKIRRTTDAATSDGRIIIPAGQMVGQILLVAVDNGVRDNDIVTDVKVRIGENDVQREFSWEALQSLNVEDYGLELASGLPPYTGVAVIDFDEDRDMRPANILNTEGLKSQTAKLILTLGSPTGVSYVDAYVIGVDRRGIGGRGSIQRRRAKLVARVKR
jgi:hypothetical protein